MSDKLQEENKISVKDVLLKVRKLEGYIKKTECRIAVHEKKLAKLRKELKSEIKLIKERLIA